MNLLAAAIFGVAGGLAGWFAQKLVQNGDGTGNRRQRTFMIAASSAVPALLRLKFQEAVGFSVVYGILSLVLISVSVFDLRKKVIPHLVTIPGTLAGISSSIWFTHIGLKDSVAGLLLGAGILLFTIAIEALRKKDVGGGDWKLAAMIGSFLGTHRIVTAMLFAGCIGFVAGLAMLHSKSGKPSALGPYLCAGAIAAIFWT